MTYPENRKPLQADDLAKMHPSTWQQECEQLRANAEEAYQAQMSAESAASWANIRAEQAIRKAKQLRRDYSLMQIDRNNLRSLLDGTEAKVDELHGKLEDAQAEAKALRAENSRLIEERDGALAWRDKDWQASQENTALRARVAALEKQILAVHLTCTLLQQNGYPEFADRVRLMLPPIERAALQQEGGE